MSNPHPSQHGTTRPPISKRVGRMAHHAVGTRNAPWGRRIATAIALILTAVAFHWLGWNGYSLRVELDTGWLLLGAFVVGAAGALLATLTSSKWRGLAGVMIAVFAAIFIILNRGSLGGLGSLMSVIGALIALLALFVFVTWLFPAGTVFPERAAKTRKRRDDGGWNVGGNTPTATSATNTPAPPAASATASQPSPTPPPASA